MRTFAAAGTLDVSRCNHAAGNSACGLSNGGKSLKPLFDVHQITAIVMTGACVAALALGAVRADAAGVITVSHRLPPVYAHYMPWFQANPAAHSWGWHWTMNHYNPSLMDHGLPQIASHYHPQIGPYDSADTDVLKYQIMLMKMTGIQGVIFDWYGNDRLFDSMNINQNVERMVPLLERAGLKFALCYEDHTVPQEIKAGIIPAGGAVHHGQQLMLWLQSHYFNSPAYIRISGRPLLLTFGQPYYNNAQWTEIFSVLHRPPVYITESFRREATASMGGFDWPIPAGGTTAGLNEQVTFLKAAHRWPVFIAAAFPGFNDIYAQAGVGHSWGHIAEDNGRTLATTLSRALRSGAAAVQLVTWNDWGEGTQIEPSIENGTRDLQIIRKALGAGNPVLARWSTADLQLPAKWLLLRKKLKAGSGRYQAVGKFYDMVLAAHVKQARALLLRFSPVR